MKTIKQEIPAARECGFALMSAVQKVRDGSHCLPYINAHGQRGAARQPETKMSIENYLSVEQAANGQYHNVVFHCAAAFAAGLLAQEVNVHFGKSTILEMAVAPVGDGAYEINDETISVHPDFASAVAAAKAALLSVAKITQ